MFLFVMIVPIVLALDYLEKLAKTLYKLRNEIATHQMPIQYKDFFTEQEKVASNLTSYLIQNYDNMTFKTLLPSIEELQEKVEDLKSLWNAFKEIFAESRFHLSFFGAYK